MGIPWKLIGKYALGFAEYALAERLAPQPPAPRPVEPPPVTPVTPAVAPEPPKPTVRDYYDDVDRIYFEILKRPTDSGAELYEGALLLQAGREAELRHNLEGRRG